MISTLLALAVIMVLNFANDSQKCAHHVSYDIQYTNVFSFLAITATATTLSRRVDWIYHICWLKKQNKIEFLMNILY